MDKRDKWQERVREICANSATYGFEYSYLIPIICMQYDCFVLWHINLFLTAQLAGANFFWFIFPPWNRIEIFYKTETEGQSQGNT